MSLAEYLTILLVLRMRFVTCLLTIKTICLDTCQSVSHTDCDLWTNLYSLFYFKDEVDYD